MPRENRKRGRRHKKQHEGEEAPAEEAYEQQEHDYEGEELESAGPSWIVGRSAYDDQQVDTDAPFGYVNQDVKAYFRTVDAKLKEWQESSGLVNDGSGEGKDMDEDPNEERHMFLSAVLSELSGQEKQLATDPDCSNILERMAYSMDDFVKRVFMDRLAGSYEQLAKHRFGSHVVQTLLMVAKNTVQREIKGVVASSDSSESDQGTLPTATQLIVNISDELIPSIRTLCMDPFISHVYRALFVLVCPYMPSAADERESILRSKKSAHHRAKQGPMKSVFGENDSEIGDRKGKGKADIACPPEFERLSRAFVSTVREGLSANEVRALAADKSACPLLQLLLEMESVQGRSSEEGSLMDSVSFGLVSATISGVQGESSDYVSTLLREPTASHLVESLVNLSPKPLFDALWKLYFEGKLNKLAVHPVANFIVARALMRLDKEQLSGALDETSCLWPKLIKNARTGVIKASIDRAADLQFLEAEVVQSTFKAFGINESGTQGNLVECVLYLKHHSEASKSKPEHDDTEQIKHKKNASEPTVQGSLLMQSLHKLHEPHNHSILDSVTSLSPSSLLNLCHNATSSRIIDAFLQSPTVPSRYRRKLILAFVSNDLFPALVEDRIGSRVGDRIWDAADPYLKEKIARGLFTHETKLSTSRYGKFFVRRLNLFLLKRDPEEWKAKQTQAQVHAIHGGQPVIGAKPVPPESKSDSAHTESGKKRKKKDRPHDEIDALFAAGPGKRHKISKLDGENVVAEPTVTPGSLTIIDFGLKGDKELDGVLNAIRNAPKEGKAKKKEKSKSRRVFL